MKNWRLLWIIIFILVLVIASLTFTLINNQTNSAIDSFDTCIAAGYPIAESYPRQCFTPDGKSFTELIPETTNIPAPPVPPNQNGIACTADAKQCPDGSWVGRTGPNCEFTACPAEE